MIIDHIGIVVKSIDIATRQWEDVFGYIKATSVIHNTRQNVFVIFLEKKNSTTIKLIEPVDEKSPVFTFAKRGGGLHHLCFKCENLEESLHKMDKQGLRVLSGPEPGEAFENEKIVFLYAHNGMKIELIDTEKRANLIIDKEIARR
ncbi:VOC family protein [Desulfofustis glycolicus]|uniref:VOC family protein n=1 Tax=Desulfofustis glycolicus TaxID=51195 RepID=UPI0009329F72|nr:VOC family protein [Desulfofustis glycolicus]